MSLHMFRGPEPVRSQSDHDDIRITKEYTCPDSGRLFWPGDTFLACMDIPPYAKGTEVKVAGDYVWLPPDVFEVIPG